MKEGSVPRTRRSNRTLAAIVVGAALAVASAAVLPPLAGRQVPPEQICLEHTATLAKAMLLYSLDYNECLFFGRGDAASPPLARGQAGQTPYLQDALGAYLPPDARSIWYCPSDTYARRDLTADSRWTGSFDYQPAGIGYSAVSHGADRDRGVRALRSELLRAYGADEMRLDHALSSYRFHPAFAGETAPVYASIVHRVYREGWGAYGYWDIDPSSAPLFEEDLPFHAYHAKGPEARTILGRVSSFRDGHAAFLPLDPRGSNKYGDADHGSGPAAALAHAEREPLVTARAYFDSLRQGKIEDAKRLVTFEGTVLRTVWQTQADQYAQRLRAGGTPLWGNAVGYQLVPGPPPGRWAIVDVQWCRLADAGWVMDEHYAYRMRTVNDQWKMVVDRITHQRGIPFLPGP